MRKTLSQFMSIVTAFAVILVSYHSVSAAPADAPKIYYVNPSGKDTNSGSSTAPFKTFTKAISVLVPGDTLMVSGTFSERLNVNKSGTVSAPINIVGNSAKIDVKGQQINGIIVTGNYVNVSGFDVKGSTQHGILLAGKYIKFENSFVHHNVLDNGSNGNCGQGDGWASGLKVYVGGENITIRGNTVYQNCGEGIAITRGKNIMVENNTVYDNYSVNIYVDNSPYTTVQNNNIYCTGIYLRSGRRPAGIAIAEEYYSGWGAQRHHNYIFNNYVDACNEGIVSWLPEVTGGKLKDSIISGNTIPTAIQRGMTIRSGNQNVTIENNTVFGAIEITYPTGVTLRNNTITTGVTSTPSKTPTATKIKTATPTKTITPSKTPTITVTPATYTPTITFTPSFTPIVSATATKLPTATPTSINDIIFDDTDSDFVYSSSGWEDINEQSANNGTYKRNPKYNSSVTFTFIGELFSVLYMDGPSFRKIDVYVDGVFRYTINRRAFTTIHQQRWDFPELLPYEEHTIKLVFTNGNAMFDGIVLITDGQIPFMKDLNLPTSTAISTSTIFASETPSSLPSATPTISSPTITPSTTTEPPTFTPTLTITSTPTP